MEPEGDADAYLLKGRALRAELAQIDWTSSSALSPPSRAG